MDRDAARGNDALLRGLPSVERVAADPRLAGLGVRPALLRDAIRGRLSGARSAILAGGGDPAEPLLNALVAELLGALAPADNRVINATGVLIHTNLGRVPVSNAAATAMAEAARSPVALEVDPGTGRRGDRQRRVSELLRVLTGSEAALVVNNNAAALLVTVAALAADRDAIVSRGEAVEIGGGFRIPDVLRQGGARLVEVGTTNRTYAHDYEDACSDTTGMLLKVHPSNFVISGYTHETTVRELATIGAAHDVPVVEDQGSGLLNPIDLDAIDLGRSLSGCLADGADIITASGDKLLGGPQCGLILGRADLVARIARHPIARAVRVDKVTLAGLEATLRHYLRGEEMTAIPLWRMAMTPVDELRRRARTIVSMLGGAEAGGSVEVVDAVTTFGGGAVPGQNLRSVALRVRPVAGIGVDRIAAGLRLGQPSVWGRVEDGCLWLDLRTVAPDDDDRLAGALTMSLQETRP